VRTPRPHIVHENAGRAACVFFVKKSSIPPLLSIFLDIRETLTFAQVTAFSITSIGCQRGGPLAIHSRRKEVVLKRARREKKSKAAQVEKPNNSSQGTKNKKKEKEN